MSGAVPGAAAELQAPFRWSKGRPDPESAPAFAILSARVFFSPRRAYTEAAYAREGLPYDDPNACAAFPRGLVSVRKVPRQAIPDARLGTCPGVTLGLVTGRSHRPAYEAPDYCMEAGP